MSGRLKYFFEEHVLSAFLVGILTLVLIALTIVTFIFRGSAEVFWFFKGDRG
jgi:hypothetical protein